MVSDVERENILDNIVTTLQGIQEGYAMPTGVSGTYNYTPVRVTRENVSWDECDWGYPTYVVLDGDENISYFGKRATNFFSVLLRCYNKFEKGTDRSVKLNKMIKDVRTALLDDPSRGGYAANCLMTGISNDEGWLAPYVVAEMTLQVEYLTLELNR